MIFIWDAVIAVDPVVQVPNHPLVPLVVTPRTGGVVQTWPTFIELEASDKDLPPETSCALAVIVLPDVNVPAAIPVNDHALFNTVVVPIETPSL